MQSNGVRATIIWLSGPAIWAAHFFLLYGIASFACTPSTPQGTIRVLSLATTAIALSALVGFLAWRSRDRRQVAGDMPAFLAKTTNGLAILAGLAIVWTAASATLIPACVAE